jgi:peptidyl-prolyl cis-trans isomerase C
MSTQNNFHKESGKAAVVALVVLAIVAVGALAFLSTQVINNKDGQQVAAADANQVGIPTPADAQQVAEADPVIVEPGNPTVASVNGENITRVDVFNFMQQLPPNMKQLPIQQIFPLSQEQVINARVITANTKGVSLENDPLVKEQLAAAKDQITRNVYIQREVEKRITEDRLKAAYDEYVKQFPDIDERQARHVLVDTEDKAKEVITKLNEGGDFATIAKETSQDATAQNGGELGFFAKGDVVPEFAEAAFATSIGEYTKKPVKTQFGYHVIKIEGERKRPPADFETAKPFLDAQLRRVVFDELIQDWREAAEIQRFDINGKPIEPSAGDETPAAPPAAQ